MKCRKEELPFLADYIRTNYVRDQLDFQNYSPDYEESFLERFDSELKIVKDVVATSKIIAEHKAVTKRIKVHYSNARNWTNKIEDYSKKASKSLTTNFADFGFKGLRKDINIKNDEGTILKFRELLQHVDANITALQSKGLTPAVRTSFVAFVNAFETDIKGQTYKIDERKDLVKNNKNAFKTLYKTLSVDILQTGKIIYKEKDKEKVKDYTFIELLKKIRVPHKKEEEEPKPVGGATNL